MATGALSPDAMAEVVEGIADGCQQSGCSLLGGETAEMPGFYPAGRYDLAGFCVAVVEENELIDGQQVQPGDAVIGVASSGVHSNGFSLVRRVLAQAKADRSTLYGPDQRPLIDDLLRPTQLYASLVKHLLSSSLPIHAMAHITGGGLPENLPRCLPTGCRAQVSPTSWARPPLFDWLQSAGGIPERDLWHTFNLGIGFCVVVPRDQIDRTVAACRAQQLQAWPIGSIVEGNPEDGVIGLPD